jgi:acetoin utilization protein AcuB
MDRVEMKRAQVLDIIDALQYGRRQGDMLVSQIMTTQPICISAETSVLDLVRMIHAKVLRHLLVSDERGRLVGVVSDRDVLRCLGPGKADKEKLSKIMARDLMSTDLVTVTSNTPIAEAIGIMIDQGISCLPILENELPVGIMTNTDLHVLLQMLLQTVRLAASEKPLAASVE